MFPEDQIILDHIASDSLKNEGYKLLVGKYKEKLYWVIRRIVGNHDDADDVLQNTFIKVSRSIDKFQMQSSLFTWMYRIASNESINFINKRKKLSLDSNKEIDENGQVGDSWFDESETVKILNRAVGELPEKQKLVFNLRYFQELPYKEIATMTETSEGALKASYHHAVKKIEEYIKATI